MNGPTLQISDVAVAVNRDRRHLPVIRSPFISAGNVRVFARIRIICLRLRNLLLQSGENLCRTFSRHLRLPVIVQHKKKSCR